MYNGAIMPNTSQNFRLNWASFGAGERRREDGADYTLFIGDLAPDVTDYILEETFKSHYPSVKGANVVTDKLTRRSKGYGFVKFGDVNKQIHALTEMQGLYCSSWPMRIGVAAHKNKVHAGGQQYSTASYQTIEGTQSEGDPNSTTIFVGGLDTNVPEEELRLLFSTYGELVHVKIPVGKRCGFVQFANRPSQCSIHATNCGASIGIFLLVRKTTIFLQRFSREPFWPSPYLDAFGEEVIIGYAWGI